MLWLSILSFFPLLVFNTILPDFFIFESKILVSTTDAISFIITFPAKATPCAPAATPTNQLLKSIVESAFKTTSSAVFTTELESITALVIVSLLFLTATPVPERPFMAKPAPTIISLASISVLACIATAALFIFASEISASVLPFFLASSVSSDVSP